MSTMDNTLDNTTTISSCSSMKKNPPARVNSTTSTDSSDPTTDPDDVATPTSFDDAGCARALPKDFSPSSTDVVLGRGKKCFGHVGNELLRLLVNATLDEYRAASSRSAKSVVILKVVDAIRSNSPNGGFVKQDPQSGRWFEVGDFLSREKTSQTFRDALAARYKSSKASKKRRRDGLAGPQSGANEVQVNGMINGMLMTAAPMEVSSSINASPANRGHFKTDPDDGELFDLLVRATDAWTMNEQQLQNVYQGGYGGSCGALDPFEPTPLPDQACAPMACASGANMNHLNCSMTSSHQSSFSQLDTVPDMDDSIADGFALSNASSNPHVNWMDAEAVFRANGWTALTDPEEFVRRSKAVKVEHGWNVSDEGNAQSDTGVERKANQEYLFKKTPKHKSRAAVMA